MRILALRLSPDQDLRQALNAWALAESISAGFILSGIGSLRQATLRFAGREQPTLLHGPFEILSLQGTLSMHGLHLHLAIATAEGQVLGGHLAEGSIIYTTAEIVLGVADELVFTRAKDEQTGFWELEVKGKREGGEAIIEGG